MEISGLLTLLARAKDLADHPMFLPVIVGNFVSKLFAQKIDSANRRLNGIEETTGMHTFDWRPKGNPFAMDMLQTTRSLNSCSATLGVLEMRISSLIQMFETILRYNDYIYDAVPTDRKEGLRESQYVLDDSIENLINLCKSLLLRVVYNQKRATTQLAVVYNFMQQKDNLTNIGVAADSRSIAQASKRDSSAMKTIAVLTMVFLPGTFISSLFAMPLMQWQNDVVLTSRFWIYWAITIPLTFLVLLLWAIWIRWSIYLQNKEDDAARKGEVKSGQLSPKALFIDFVQLVWLMPRKKTAAAMG
ncbi:MAG: hypothetical protein M1830_004380 [Pleopsidium flavum]|nr:MAG: hypothetical protein M1830_004380 [Pleopsidium flavum]